MPYLHELANDKIRIKISHYANGTYYAHVIDLNGNVTSDDTTSEYASDDKGALIYVCVVILMYALSIILMIVSLSNNNRKSDQGVSKYMKDMDKLRRLERRQLKFKTRLAMQKKRVRNILGADSAILANIQEQSPSVDKPQEQVLSLTDGTTMTSLLLNSSENGVDSDSYPRLAADVKVNVDCNPTIKEDGSEDNTGAALAAEVAIESSGHSSSTPASTHAVFHQFSHPEYV